jgi:hypothetical protein
MFRLLILVFAAFLSGHAAAFSSAQSLTSEDSSQVNSQSSWPPCGQITARTLEGVIRELRTIDQKPVFIRNTTDPIFYFENLSGVEFRAGKELAAEHRSRFQEATIEVAELTPNHPYLEDYDGDDCGKDAAGHWVQISPVVRHPASGESGVFVRVTPGPCLPFGGKRYWAVIESLHNPKIIKLIDLQVDEF